MNKEVFFEYVKEELEKRGIRCNVSTVSKVNAVYTSLTRTPDGVSTVACPAVNLDDLYDSVRAGCLDPDEAVERAAEVLSMSEEKSWNLDKINDYSSAKERLFVRICNPEWNEEFLSRVPNRRFGPFAMTYHVAIDVGENVASATVSNLLLESWGITEETLDQDAMRSAPKIFPAKKMAFGDLEFFKGIPENPAFRMVLTNESSINGAAAMVYPGVLKEICEDLGVKELVLLPSSIHEVIIGTDASNIAVLTEIVRGVNAAEVRPEDLLYDRPVIYDSDTDQLKEVFA